MAAQGRKVEGWKKKGPLWGMSIPIPCLDFCRCYGELHKKVDLCSCTDGWKCASCVLLVESLEMSYPTDVELFRNG